MKDPEHRTDWMPRFPMVKAAYQCMRAVQEFLDEKNIAQIEGWITSGESKRGWTTFLSGAVECESCAAKVIAIVPIVPIIPDLIKDLHR